MENSQQKQQSELIQNQQQKPKTQNSSSQTETEIKPSQQQLNQKQDDGQQIQQQKIEYNHNKKQEQKQDPLEQFIQSDSVKAQSYKKIATALFNNKQYLDAIQNYKYSLQYCSSQFSQQRKSKAILYSNIAICFIKMSQPNVDFKKEIIKYCKKSIKQDQKYYKAWLNLAKYQQQAQQWEDAFQSYKAADKIDQQIGRSQPFIKSKIAKLNIKVNQINQKRKEQVIGGLKTIGNSILGYFGMSLDNFKLQQGQNGGYSVQYNPN